MKETNPTLEDVYTKGKRVGAYQSRCSLSQYTMWQINWQGDLHLVLTHDNQNEIVIIYNSAINKVLYISPHYQLGLSDLRVK